MTKEENMFYDLKEELSSEEKETIIKNYIEGKSEEETAQDVNKKLEVVKKYIKSYELMRKEEKSSTELTAPQVTSLQKEINIVDNLHFVMGKLRSLVEQLEVEDEYGIKKANVNTLKPYLESLKNFTDVTQWMADRRIKLEELIENQIYKQAVLDELKLESPELYKRVLKRIQGLKKQKDLLS